VEVAAGVDTAHFIPGNNVAYALSDLQVAMWADPGFAIIGVRPDAGLGCVLDAALDFASAKAESNRVQI
jgi:hypothetical protein